jgi:AraC-like DNA-binding protein
MYDPKTHTFDGFGCLDTKRASHTQVELDHGKVVITGNWYHEDAIEIYDGNITFTNVKNTSQHRTLTNVFRIAPDDVIIFGGQDYHGNDFDTIIVDRLKGEPFTDPLFETWKPTHLHISIHNDDSFIGDETKGIYSYLFPVRNKEGQIAIAKSDGMKFSLVPTTSPIPTKFQENTIIYYSQMLVDRKAQKGYIMGNDSIHQTSSHIYILCIDYSPMTKGEPCPVTLYYTDPIPEFVDASPLITPNGNLVLTGGTGKKENPSHNFYPLAHVFLFHFGSDEFVISSYLSPIPWMVGGSLLLAIVIICIYLLYRQPKQERKVENEVETPKTRDPKEVANAELMQRIHHLVVDEKQFLNSDLTVLALAKQLGTHRNNVSACVNEQKGCNFTQYINGYRVECAKQLMLKYPDLKMNAIGSDSGFANDTSFFRTFKALTGQTPNEWKASQLSNPK